MVCSGSIGLTFGFNRKIINASLTLSWFIVVNLNELVCSPKKKISLTFYTFYHVLLVLKCAIRLT